MSAVVAPAGRPWLNRLVARPEVRVVTLATSVAVTGLSIAYLLASGLWYLALALLVILPGFALVHRAPLAGVGIWLVVAPYLLLSSGVSRYGFWLVHRALPIGVLATLAGSRMIGIRSRPLGRLGGPESLMVAYLGVSVLSIGYTSDSAATSLIELFDRVAIPMCLYAVVRLIRPTGDSLRWLVPIAAVTVVTQTAIGGASWMAPGILPTDWLGRAGSRTIGSLATPSAYGVTVLAAGGIALHAAATQRRPAVRIALRLLFGVSVLMAVLTFSRGVWLASLVVVAALALVHPRQVRHVAAVALPLIVLLVLTGVASNQIATIEKRFGSEETTLDRLPVALASWRMVQERPITGWGYANFDKYDREFQGEVSGYVPEKDHASHNLYLTLLAEQGIVGLLLYLGPAIWLLARTAASYSRLPRSGLASRKLVILLWAVLAAHVAANNFSNMRVVFGLGQWWLVLGLIATLVSAQPTSERELPSPLRIGSLR